MQAGLAAISGSRHGLGEIRREVRCGDLGDDGVALKAAGLRDLRRGDQRERKAEQ